MKALGSLSMAAVLLALAVVLLGQQHAAEKLLGPAGKVSASSLARTPVSRAFTAADSETFQALFADAQGDAVSGRQTTAGLTRALARSQPADKVGKPGGVSVTVRRQNVQFCKPISEGFFCSQGALVGGHLSFASGDTLAKAQAAVERASASPAHSGAAAPGNLAAIKKAALSPGG